MPETSPRELLRRNERSVESLPDGYFDEVQDKQRPAAVSMCCSDSRVSQEEMWSIEEPGWLFTPSKIGNQVWDVVEGERVVDGSFSYPLVYTDTRTAVVVGHTGCGAITAALDMVRGGSEDGSTEGGRKLVNQLVSVVEVALDDPRVDEDQDVDLVDQLVEYNVHSQVEFLLESEEVDDDVSVYGFVFDLHGVYGGERGTTYLVDVDGVTGEEQLREIAGEGQEDRVGRLLR